MLTADVKARCSVDQLHLCLWMRGPTSSLTPYRKILHTEENCLPRLFQPQISHTTECSNSYTNSPPESTASLLRIHAQTQTLPSAAEGRTASTGTTTPTFWATTTNAPPPAEVPRRKITAVERLEQRMRALNDPAASTVVLHSVVPPSSLPAAATGGGGGMRAKISSSRKKVFQTFVQHSSSRSFC